MSEYVTEDNFMIAEGSEGELYVYLSAKKAQPETPRIVYDGHDHAIFLRSPKQKIILDYINPEVRDKLRKAPEVIVVETILENIKDCYVAKMNMVDRIPVDWSQLGLSNWEDAVLKN